jgi:hypothetical protein
MLLGIVYQAVTSYYVSVVLMGRISNFSRNLLVIGFILVFLAGFSTSPVSPRDYWGLYGNELLFIGGSISILMAVVLMLVERKQLDP